MLDQHPSVRNFFTRNAGYKRIREGFLFMNFFSWRTPQNKE